MDKRPKRGDAVRVFCAALFASLLFLADDASCLSINSQDVQAMAIYGRTSGFGIGLQPNQIVFNLTDPSLIANLISSIEFSLERDCSSLASRTDAYVYIKFKNGCIEVYELLGLWSHFCKLGFWGCCYFVSEGGQTLFENNAQ